VILACCLFLCWLPRSEEDHEAASDEEQAEGRREEQTAVSQPPASCPVSGRSAKRGRSEEQEHEYRSSNKRWCSCLFSAAPTTSSTLERVVISNCTLTTSQALAVQQCTFLAAAGRVRSQMVTTTSSSTTSSGKIGKLQDGLLSRSESPMLSQIQFGEGPHLERHDSEPHRRRSTRKGNGTEDDDDALTMSWIKYSSKITQGLMMREPSRDNMQAALMELRKSLSHKKDERSHVSPTKLFDESQQVDETKVPDREATSLTEALRECNTPRAYFTRALRAVMPSSSSIIEVDEVRGPQLSDASLLELEQLASQIRNIRVSDIVDVKYLARGGMSTVHEGFFEKEGKQVVLKVPGADAEDPEDCIKALTKEIFVLTCLKHDRIVGIVGAGITDSTGMPYMVLNKCTGKTLDTHIGSRTAGSAPPGSLAYRMSRRALMKKFPIHRGLSMMVQLAEAIRYMHEEPCPGVTFLHRDLKPDNVMVDADDTITLIDLGLAKPIPYCGKSGRTPYAMTGQTGSMRYMSPEVAHCEPYTVSSDVYAYSLILWESIQLQKPFSGMSVKDLYKEVLVLGGKRPVLPTSWPSALCRLLAECWDHNPEERPPMHEVHIRLTAILEELKMANDLDGREGSSKSSPPRPTRRKSTGGGSIFSCCTNGAADAVA
jgi:serine/threonine protein kinase